MRNNVNLNWDSVLYLEGREPNVSYPNSYSVKQRRHVKVFLNPHPSVAINQSCDQLVGQLMGCTNAEM